MKYFAILRIFILCKLNFSKRYICCLALHWNVKQKRKKIEKQKKVGCHGGPKCRNGGPKCRKRHSILFFLLPICDKFLDIVMNNYNPIEPLMIVVFYFLTLNDDA